MGDPEDQDGMQAVHEGNEGMDGAQMEDMDPVQEDGAPD